MRYRPRTDANQSEIVKEYRKNGFSVQSLAMVGRGCPDLLVGKDGKNYLVEIKDPEKTPSQRRLTPDQITWHSGWKGQVYVIETPSQAVGVFNG